MGVELVTCNTNPLYTCTHTHLLVMDNTLPREKNPYILYVINFRYIYFHGIVSVWSKFFLIKVICSNPPRMYEDVNKCDLPLMSIKNGCTRYD